MRILHINAGNLWGGIESALETLARTPCGLTHEFALVFEGALAVRLRAAGARVHVLGAARARRPWTVWRARRRLGVLLASGPPTVVVAHGGWSHALSAPATRRAGAPRVLYCHAAPGDGWVDRWARWSPPDLIVANSAFTARGAARAFPGVECAVVHPPVPRPARPDPASRERLRAALGVRPDEVVIVMVGRLDPCKGHLIFVEALRQLRRDAPWRAWIVGGAQRDEERALARTLAEAVSHAGLRDRAALLGHRDDVPAVLAAADVYCQPNVTPDSFGLSFVEALHAGLPVVTSALGGAPEVVDATCGVLLPVGSSSAVAAALERLVGDAPHRRSLGAAGPARAAGLCDPALQSRRLTDVVAGLLVAGRR